MGNASATATKKRKTPRFLVIGAGSRGNAYGRAVTNATSGVIHAVAETDPFKRREFGSKYIWRDGRPVPGQEFGHWREWLEWETLRRRRLAEKSDTGAGAGAGAVDEDDGSEGEGVDGVFVCTLDESHVEVLLALAPLNLHVMCEKPLATSLRDCLAISAALTSAQKQAGTPRIFSIGHVLRYSPHNRLLRKLLLTDRVVGDIVSLEHTEPVGWSHFSHSYVRGNWRRETAAGDGSLLTKCCHDIDFILWLLCSPGPEAPYDAPHHAPSSITSMGTLTQFKRSRKPAAAGTATNCLSCPIERDCQYSAVRLYRDKGLRAGNTGWPVKIVCPDIEDTLKSQGPEAAEAHLMRSLGENYDPSVTPDSDIAARPWFGRCVWESDNSVCDDQVVSIRWEDEEEEASPSSSQPPRTSKLATLHMIAPTERQCDRRGRVYGTAGELVYDSHTITTHVFAPGKTRVEKVPPPPPDQQESHGGGDYGLTRAFVQAVDAVENDGWEVRKAQAEFVGCTLEEAVRSHAMVFAAEEARRKGQMVDWGDWWKEKTGQNAQLNDTKG